MNSIFMKFYKRKQLTNNNRKQTGGCLGLGVTLGAEDWKGTPDSF